MDCVIIVVKADPLGPVKPDTLKFQARCLWYKPELDNSREFTAPDTTGVVKKFWLLQTPLPLGLTALR